MFDIFSSIPPAFIMILGSMLLPAIPKNNRSWFIILLPVLTLLASWNLAPEGDETFHIAGFDLLLTYVHDFSPIFATIFCLASLTGVIFALNKINLTEIMAALIYAGGAIGVVFSGDLISLFIYWEIMAIASTIVVLLGGTEKSKGAAIRYAYMHFFGGVVLLAGIGAVVAATGSTAISHISFDLIEIITSGNISLKEIGAFLMLLGILINAGCPPFGSWLPDSYPQASYSGAVFLSAFTTKTSVFVLLTIFAGTGVLIFAGLVMIFYGIIYAMLENNSRRILSYSIINQVGFMVTGVGIGTELALLGVAAHAFCHIIYKALLFMSAGSVFYMTGYQRCTDLGGLYKTMKWTTFFGIVGALSISAFPLTSGFVSKSLITSAAGYEHLAIVWFLLVAASAGVFLHAGVKFPWFVFFHRDSGLRPKDPPKNMMVAMSFFAFLCILPGVFPTLLYKLLPYEVDYQAYTGAHIISQLQLLLFAGLAFFMMLPQLKRTTTISLDFDWLYRVFLKDILLLIEIFANSLREFLITYSKKFGNMLKEKIYFYHGPEGVLARNWALGNTVLYATTLLGLFLILYYIGN